MKSKVFNRTAEILFLLLAFLGLGYWLGFDNIITRFFMKKVLLSPFNIVGIIMIICSFCGIWIGKARGHRLLVICKIINICFSINLILNLLGINII